MRKIPFPDTAHMSEDNSVSPALSLNYFSLESSLVGDYTKKHLAVLEMIKHIP